MAVALYGHMLVHPASVETVRRYLYGATEVLEAAPIREYGEDGSVTTGRLVFLILRTEEHSGERAASAQQQQCDRLASGMHALTIGYNTRQEARDAAEARALDNDWGLVSWAPFAVGATV